MKSEEMYNDLSGGDLRSIANVKLLTNNINTQNDFDELFTYIFSEDRLIVMRSADAIEKITKKYPNFLDKHKFEIIALSEKAKNKELKWHLALLLDRIKLSETEKKTVYTILKKWLMNKKESKIVRVNSLQTLYSLVIANTYFEKNFSEMIKIIKDENIPSINARIKILNL